MYLLRRAADGRRGGDNLGPHRLAVHLPGAQVIDRCFIEPDQRSEWPADEVQLVLDNQVRRAQGRNRYGFDAGQVAPLGVRVAVLDVRAAIAVPGTVAVHQPEEHADRPFPGHLGELVHSGDDQGGQPAVDLLVNDQGRNPLVRRLAGAERAPSHGVSAVDDGAPGALLVGFHLDVLAGVDGRPAPGAVGQLGRRAPTGGCAGHIRGLAGAVFLDGLSALFSPVGRGPLPNPQANAEGLSAPSGIPGLHRFTANDFAGADQPRGTLELLQGQQTQCVSHQDGDTGLT